MHLPKLVTHTLGAACLLFWAAPLVSSGQPLAGWSPPSVRPASGLVARAGDGRAYLEWNANLEENLGGYVVYRRKAGTSTFGRVTVQPVQPSEYVDSGLANGQAFEYAVSAMLKGGAEGGRSNVAQVTPRSVQAPVITQGPATVEVPGFGDVRVTRAVRVTFENGHRLVFDTELGRVRDWQTEDGTHLIYPLPYGNAIDITSMSDMGFPEAGPATEQQPALPPQITADYTYAKNAGSPGSPSWMRAWYVGHSIADNAITFEWHLPLSGPTMPRLRNWDRWVWGQVWETWWPVTRTIGGTEYHGLARKIELALPSYYKNGYSVCPSDGFGVNGSCDRAVTYEVDYHSPGLTETHWTKGRDAHGLGQPRQTRGFHPSGVTLQSMPYLFAHFPQGTLLIAPQRYYYSNAYSWTNYAAQGKDGLWPNFTIDLAAAGKRSPVETFEYLWTSGTRLEAPQQFIDAAFHYRRNLADLYGLDRHVPSFAHAWDYPGPEAGALKGKSQTEALQAMRDWGRKIGDAAERMGVDLLGGAFQLWTSAPEAVPDDIRLNPMHPINRAIADTVATLKAKGIGFSYWTRPEFTRSSVPNVLSEFFVHPGQYGGTRFPPLTPIFEKQGLPLVRNHPKWIRVGRSGDYPAETPYNWTPMSLTLPAAWYDEVTYKQLVMMKKLGYATVFQDGIFGTMSGVDYTGGRARPVQPYWWRYIQDIYRLGLNVQGECSLGWGGASTIGLDRNRPQDLWSMAHCSNRGNRDGDAIKWFSPEWRHRSLQLYCGTYVHMASAPEHAKVIHFGRNFLKEHGHPDRVVLEGLRWDENGRQWRWDNVWWEFAGGKRVRYPNFAEVLGQ